MATFTHENFIYEADRNMPRFSHTGEANIVLRRAAEAELHPKILRHTRAKPQPKRGRGSPLAPDPEGIAARRDAINLDARIEFSKYRPTTRN